MSIVQIDFETRSEVDLNACGAYVYATHPSTGIYVLYYAFDDEEPVGWVPGEPVPARLADHVRDGGVLTAWNAQFERLIWWYILTPDHGFPEPRLEQFQCTAARARAHGLPGKLGECARAMGLPDTKQSEGTRLIKTYSVHNVPWEQIPEADQALWHEYCAQDVVVERGIGKCLRELDDTEWAEYHLNERICDRGIPVDLKLAAAALEYSEEVRDEVDDKIRALTRGAVKGSTSRKDRDEWVLPQLNADQIKLLTVHKNGVAKLSFDSDHREALALHPQLPAPVAQWLTYMEEAGGATISKYKAMALRELDGRINGALVFNGAGQTGRFASRGLQMHNLRRDSFDDPEPVIRLLLAHYELPEVTTTLARLVRSAVYAPEGMTWCDWAAIEGRVAPWLADSSAGEAKLDLFRQGVDVYVATAATTFNIPMEEVTDTQRQIGKVQELSLQFLGGLGALKAMARNYGVHIEDAHGEQLKEKWRAANPWAQTFGRALETAAFRAMRRPGDWFEAGRIAYAYDGGDWLWCKLPSGRLLAYYQPKIELVDTPWGEEREAVVCLWGAGKAKVGAPWPRRAMHPGIFIENVTQAVAADLLREALLAADEDHDLPVFLHVHDEIVVEGYCEELLQSIMLQAPEWAGGLPLAAKAGSGTRYGK